MRQLLTFVLGVLALASSAHAQIVSRYQRSGLVEITSVHPPANAVVGPTQAITFRFDRVLDPGSVNATSFRVEGLHSGLVPGQLLTDADGRRVVFTPSRAYFAGERVQVRLSHAIRGIDRRHLRPGGYALEFRVAAAPSAGSFLPALTFDNDGTGFISGLREIVAGDLDRDGTADLVTLTDRSNDLRTYLAQGGGSIAYGLRQVVDFPDDPEHVELRDVNHDGWIDALVTVDGSVGLQLFYGLGDGSFLFVQSLGTGFPFVLLDVDGDAAIDVVGITLGGLSVFLNDGFGGFLPATFFPLPWFVERLEPGDMNGDGLTDLIVVDSLDSLSGDQARTLLADGNGGFVPAGPAWNLVGGSSVGLHAADVDGDGDLDACVANIPDTLGVLENNGDGTFAAVRVLDYGTIPTSNDLGDIDGDGDLDWLLSSGRTIFGEDSWRVYTNDGDAHFTLAVEIASLQQANGACLLDADSDGDLDLALVDRESDLVHLQENQ